MRRARTFIAFTVVLGGLLMSSCNKHSIKVPQSNDPVFKAEGTIDANQFELVAGDDNAFMFTSIESENNVPIYSGKLSNGNLSIEIGIYDGLIDIPGHNVINSMPYELIFSRKTTSPIAFLSKESFPNADIIDHVSWSVDGLDSLNTMTIYEPGKYQVCADIVFSDGSSNVLCSELILGYARHANFQIKHFLNQNGTLTAWVEDPQVAVEKIKWYLDDVLISSEAELTYNQLSTENHILRADVSFENGVKRSKNMIVDGSLSGKFIDDLTFFETGTLALLHRDFNIRLKLVQDGMTFSSDQTNNSLNTVSFSDVSYYAKDANGNDVYKVKAHIVATVIDVQNVNGSRQLEFDTTFGIAIPKD
ncbi:MAG: hypothetical protein HRT58_21665 [Crocinitomicaceae bacterium]|nr:hypothetical protein [Flavobacteriales bacterium]NQZ38282.1 hypothetical protein [Crocinitomicaceae bacterium]